ncbi:preprotein translocase, SecG subunit [Hahella chejuensis KCTC 2396]|uniref:Protein-export membrane protein SecG n=1 Tax=Hahella chejuensis (strain KCTC 2396) TaxID=349521 RepID=Q2SML6_HAHCH|nr:preprotein translocase subunit SecG [Hahella chejuensis]ABC28108.1 preprotein translocase, SecG subunit [Hahella chejuensis KCTC 2396]
MELFETLIVIVHVIVAAGVIGLVLIQQGKGADMGASFGGGASQTVFGSSGSGSFLTNMTTTLAIVFFLSSFALAYVAKQKASQVTASGVPVIETVSGSSSESDELSIDADSTNAGEVQGAAEAPSDSKPELE